MNRTTRTKTELRRAAKRYQGARAKLDAAQQNLYALIVENAGEPKGADAGSLTYRQLSELTGLSVARVGQIVKEGR